MFSVMPARVFPFEDTEIMDEEAVHQMLGDDFDSSEK